MWLLNVFTAERCVPSDKFINFLQSFHSVNMQHNTLNSLHTYSSNLQLRTTSEKFSQRKRARENKSWAVRETGSPLLGKDHARKPRSRVRRTRLQPVPHVGVQEILSAKQTCAPRSPLHRCFLPGVCCATCPCGPLCAPQALPRDPCHACDLAPGPGTSGPATQPTASTQAAWGCRLSAPTLCCPLNTLAGRSAQPREPCG